ncbi:MAG: glycosyltransferase family 4 protein [Patescibacteria group bacterium]|jgi:glycosyltransferase involved in cell wall biosynthesis
MKLLIATGIYPPEIGGPAGYVRGLATELVSRGYAPDGAGRGHEVNVVTYGTSKTEDGRGFKVTVIPRTYGPLVRYCRYMLAVRRLARMADLVYLQGPVSEGLPGMLGALLAGKKAILKVVGDYAWEQYQTSNIEHGTLNMEHGQATPNSKYQIPNTKLELLDEFLTHRHGGKIRLFELIERWVAKKAKEIIVPSKYLKTVVEQWGVPADKIKVIYNSIPPLPEPKIPLNLPLSRETSDSPLDKGGRGDFRKVILTVVRAVPWKGGDFLCDCLKQLPEDYALVVIGDGPSLAAWKQHAEEIGVSGRVRWLGRLSRQEVADWYNVADVFVLATGYEGFPHVVVEACSVGLPCIVSDRGGNPEIKEFFPELVTIAPYLDKQAWIETIISPRLRHPSLGVREGKEEGYSPLSFTRMVDETFDVLKANL